MGQNTLLVISLLLIALLEGGRSSGKLSYGYFAISYLSWAWGRFYVLSTQGYQTWTLRGGNKAVCIGLAEFTITIFTTVLKHAFAIRLYKLNYFYSKTTKVAYFTIFMDYDMTLNTPQIKNVCRFAHNAAMLWYPVTWPFILADFRV